MPSLPKKRSDFIARNDGVHRTVVRNVTYTKATIGLKERHNERLNECYFNEDIIPERKDFNVHFKECQGTYLEEFQRLCDEKIISTRGLKEGANIIDELVFDVNSRYFEEQGGYDFAVKFFQEAYEMAVAKVGGEQYILSAVLHADERNKALSEELGKDVFHYHLHVTYIPVVEKKVLWTKRCKDVEKIGTVKEVITQVSHSKKWGFRQEVDKNGKKVNVKPYSILQDEYFQYMKEMGFTGFERGEFGSKEKHLSDVEFKVEKEKERLSALEEKGDNLEKEVEEQSKALEVVAKKKNKLADIDGIEAKPLPLTSKVMVETEDLEKLKTLGKKQIATDKKNKEKDTKIKALTEELQEEKQNCVVLTNRNRVLSHSNTTLKEDNTRLIAELTGLQKIYQQIKDFLQIKNLLEEWEKYRESLKKVVVKKPPLAKKKSRGMDR